MRLPIMQPQIMQPPVLLSGVHTSPSLLPPLPVQIAVMEQSMVYTVSCRVLTF